MEKPLVSVVMITYGHEQYIEAAIASILDQDFNGSIELIIANDNSPDNTDAVISGFLERSRIPAHVQVKYTRHEMNKGMMPNFIWAINQASGTYLAVCEGDDYWTDPLKLQKQVDFLEANPDYNVTVGRYKFYYESSKTFRENTEIVAINQPLTLRDYIAFNFSHTATFLLRKPATVPDWLYEVFAGDQSLMIISAENKKIKYFNEFFSVYRINDGSVTSQSRRKDPAIAYNNTNTFLNHVNEYTQFKFEKQIKRRKKLNKLFFKLDGASGKIQSIYYRGLIYLYRWYMIKNI